MPLQCPRPPGPPTDGVAPATPTVGPHWADPRIEPRRDRHEHYQRAPHTTSAPPHTGLTIDEVGTDVIEGRGRNLQASSRAGQKRVRDDHPDRGSDDAEHDA